MDLNQEILELLSASLQRQDRMVEQLENLTHELSGFRRDVNQRFDQVDKRFGNLEDRLARVEHQQVTTNLHIMELKHPVQKLNDQMENFAQHEERIRKLESFMRKAS